MIYRVAARVEPLTVGTPGVTFTVGSDVRAGLDLRDKDKALMLFVERRVVGDHESLAKFRAGAGVPEIRIPESPHFAELLSVLQYFECLGSFLLGLERIDWASCERRWVPETDAERNAIQVSSFTINEGDYLPSPPLLPQLGLSGVAQNYGAWSPYTLLFAMVRSGQLHYKGKNYLEAFICFYLFLEGAFGQGKTKTTHLVDALRKAPQLQRAARQAMINFQTPHSAEHNSRLGKLLKRYTLPQSPEGLIRLTVKLRGELFHMTPRALKPQSYALRRWDLHTASFLAMTLAILSATAVLAEAGGL